MLFGNRKQPVRPVTPLAKFSGNVEPTYLLQNRPRLCNSGTTNLINSSNAPGRYTGDITKPSPASSKNQVSSCSATIAVAHLHQVLKAVLICLGSRFLTRRIGIAGAKHFDAVRFRQILMSLNTACIVAQDMNRNGCGC